ncbi:hypothetical protein BH23CHL8_BH23CHL8_05470 [soil metagenome]
MGVAPTSPALIRREQDGAVLCRRLAFASSIAQRTRGLIGRAAMDPDEGLFIATSSIHMMFMRFAIDALFLSAPGVSGARRVVAIREDLPPWRGVVWPVRGAKGVVELAAGTLRSRGVVVGDVVTFESADEAAGAAGEPPASEA